jgi:phage-related protein
VAATTGSGCKPDRLWCARRNVQQRPGRQDWYKILHMSNNSHADKEIRWVGSAYDDLLGFPYEPRRKAGFQLGKVQAGLDPEDWKPFDAVGAGVREIRIKDDQGIYRVMYVAKFEEAIYVLHCFKKKTQATSKHDKEIADTRYRAIVRDRKGQK